MNIYVSNLNFRVDDNGLHELFANYGEVTSAKVIIDKFNGRSKGFGFVEMPDDAAAETAMKELDQSEQDGKVINVTEARPREERPRNNNNRNFRSNNSGGYRDNNKRW